MLSVCSTCFAVSMTCLTGILLTDELVVARADNLLKKVSRAYAQVDLLILDE